MSPNSRYVIRLVVPEILFRGVRNSYSEFRTLLILFATLVLPHTILSARYFQGRGFLRSSPGKLRNTRELWFSRLFLSFSTRKLRRKVGGNLPRVLPIREHFSEYAIEAVTSKGESLSFNSRFYGNIIKKYIRILRK